MSATGQHQWTEMSSNPTSLSYTPLDVTYQQWWTVTPYHACPAGLRPICRISENAMLVERSNKHKFTVTDRNISDIRGAANSTTPTKTQINTDMWGRKLWLYPLTVFISTPVFFFVTYAIAVCLKHVDPGFPYISDTGTFPPESCIFGQLLNILAVLIAMTLYIRFRHVDEKYKNSERKYLPILNKFSFFLGIMVPVGISIVANFQESNVFYGHIVGAILAFGLGGLGYGYTQTVLSYQTKLPGSTIFICHLRAALCVISSVLFCVGILALFAASFDHFQRRIIASKISFEKKTAYTSSKHWKISDGGYAEHLVATISEWLVALLDVAFLFTLVPEFRLISMSPPTLRFHSSEQIMELNSNDSGLNAQTTTSRDHAVMQSDSKEKN